MSFNSRRSTSAMSFALLLVLIGCGLELPSPTTRSDDSKNSSEQSQSPGAENPGADPADTGKNPDPDYDGEGVLFGLEPMSATIKRSYFSLEKNALTLAIEYFTCEYGKSDLKIELSISSSCGESYPLSCQAKLFSTPQLPDPCKAGFTKEVIKTFSLASLGSRPAVLSISGAKNPVLASIMVRSSDSAVPQNFTIKNSSFNKATKELTLETQHTLCEKLGANDVYLDLENTCTTADPKTCSATLKVNALSLQAGSGKTCEDNIDQTFSFWLEEFDTSARLNILGESGKILRTVTLD